MLSIFKNPRLLTKFRKTHLPYFDYYLSFCAYKKIMPPKRKLTTSQAENGAAAIEESPKKPKNAKTKAEAVKRTLRSKKEPDDSKPEKNETKAPEKVKVEKTKVATTKTAKAKPVKKEDKEMEMKASAKDVEMDEDGDFVEAPVKAAKKTKAAVTKKVVKKKKNEKKDNEENIAKEANEIDDEEAKDSGMSDEEPPKTKKVEKPAAKEPPKKRGPKPKPKKKETEPEKPEKEVKSDEPKKRGRKPKAQPEDNGVEKEEKSPEVKPKSGKESSNASATDWDKIDFSCNRQNNEGNEFNMKISSWNVGGLRACIAKGGLKFLDYEQPDIICLQETKCADEKMPKEILEIADYKLYWCHSKKDGYAGVGLLSKVEPISVQYGIGMEEHDDEGRCLTAEYENFHVVCVYVPNAGKQLVTLPKRLKWNEDFKAFIQKLDKKKPVIICGDMNVAHNEIDLKNPKNNKRNAGFTQEERDGLTDFLGSGFIDSYRTLYPDKPDVYTFWTYMANARAKNVGWRLDYFLVSERIKDKICDNVVRSEVLGSDHCPITLFINL